MGWYAIPVWWLETIQPLLNTISVCLDDQGKARQEARTKAKDKVHGFAEFRYLIMSKLLP